ncbi:hypothetical protein F4778DRAFT_762024 [Xylariomycetidae sp. FL2044]|nr:hypothetical protein F4778DRAFT_762024 [Xylariomycetidae sp. FL2044]
MSSIESRRRSRARFEEDEENEDDRRSSGSETSKKQRRYADRARTDVGEEEEDEEEGYSDNDLPPARGKRKDNRVNGNHMPNGHTNNLNEFHPGAIVRVLVDNFVTYEHAEFFPGPHLNMVIGPNGTGKSSLVCAICLGLGYHPKHLGRASHVGEFVKHGKDVATIEVELQRRPNELENHVIRVQINKEDNGRKWWLNGKESTHKAIQGLTRNLRIQIDNLCQFLPQDKVAEFAGLTPIQLLHETLRAAAPEEMIGWQTQLIDLHKDHKKVKEQTESCAETLRGHENRQQGLQADVDRLHEREAIKKRIEDLRNAYSVAAYNDVRRKWTDARKRRDDAKVRYKDLERACGPAFEAVTLKREYCARVEPVVASRRDVLRRAERTADEMLQRIDAQQDKIKHVQIQTEAEEASHSTKRGHIGKIRKSITDLQAKEKNKPAEFVAAEWNGKIRQKEEVLRSNEAQTRELDTQFEELKVMSQDKKARIRQAELSLKALDSKQGQRLAHLKKVHADAAKGWDWLKNNQDQFDKEVFGPPMLICSITDSRYSDLIQSLLGKDDFCCFITQNKEDLMKLSHQFYKVMGLSVTIRACADQLDSYRPPLPKGQLQHLGFDGYAVDYIEGPPTVLAMLCSERRLHASGVGLSELTDEQFDAIIGGERITNFAAGSKQFRITRRREYGPDAVSTTTKPITTGPFWTDRPVDNSERAEIELAIKQLQEEIRKVNNDGHSIKNRLKEIREGEDEINSEIATLKKEKSELQRAVTSYATIKDRIVSEERSLAKAEDELRACRERIFGYLAQEDELLIEKANMVLKHHEHLPSIRDAYAALLDAQIRLVEAKSDAEGLEARNSGIKERLDNEKKAINEFKDEIDRLKEEALRAKRKVEEAVASDDPQGDRLSYLTELCAGKSLEDIKDEVSAEEAKLELIHGVDPSILRQFEKRAQEIENLARRKEELNGKIDKLSREIERLMLKWEPGVDALVGKINEAFSYNFEQISCAGEVGIHKDEDFEQWCIEIKVKFRENETLQQLNQHRQSGGERAVSTIFYLMALQSMAQAPFRVVDEINQGMDPRNERMVHERMVEIACREHTSQYFLITPKLLTGLKYDERMRVLCIASGEHMPSQGGKLDFGRLLKIQRRLIGTAA